ncbi:GTP-binding protein [Vallitalea okinawensis]|uniref:GTP-binding protein n=1 Tax=Vallitalea okinawensis TaxID=2078660 RepID=UPI000CFC1C33|nr:GTP-binding protein [Vallitalea okinawensis]
MSKLTKIYLITGFLGSGKTTFLQKQLEQQSHKVGVLMNEFGKTSIDGTLVEEQDMDMIELTNGSIFCSCLKDHFIEGLKELISRNLDCIYIESSGLADPSNMVTIVDLLRKQCRYNFTYIGAICMVDCLHFFKEYEMLVSVGNQIRHSQIIILNKVDLVEPSRLNEIKELINQLNQKAYLIETTYGNITIDQLSFKAESMQKPSETSNTTSNRPRTITITVKESNIEINDIITLLKRIKSHCYRIKGLLTMGDRTYKLDAVQDKLEISEYSKDVGKHHQLVLISSIGTKLIRIIQEEMPKALVGQININIE